MNPNDLFYYKDGKIYNKHNRSANARKDKEAGYNDKRYYRVWYNGKLHLTHRVIWEMLNGPIPANLCIDHIDHNGLNNKIENLRVVTTAENSKNLPNVSNLHWVESRQVWQAEIRVKGKSKWLGYHKDKEFAELVVKEAREKYGFHPNHGAS